jgi:predicted transcriptional regulator
MAGKENQVDAAETLDAIRSFFNASHWKTVIVKAGDRPIGYITADELLRAHYQTKDATTLV